MGWIDAVAQYKVPFRARNGSAAVKLLSRRNLLASLSSLLLSTAAEANPSFHDSVSASCSGRINLGLNGLTYYMAFYSFLNAWKSGAPIQVINNDVSYWSNIPPGSPNSAWGRFLDHDGEFVGPLPVGTTQMERIFYSSPRDGLPDGYNRIGESLGSQMGRHGEYGERRTRVIPGSHGQQDRMGLGCQ